MTGDAAALRQLRLRAPHRQQRVGPGTAFVGWLLISVGVGALLLAAGRHVVPGNSDGATVVLEAKAMLHGNLALSGWTLSNDSFWTVDAPFYVVALAVRGLGHALLTEVPAVIAALVAVTGMRLARDDAGGAPAWAGSLTVLALLALPVPAFAFEFVQGPLHVATTLWCLLAFALLRRGRFGPGWVGAVVLIAAGLLGDLQTLALGVFPLLAAAATAAARRRSWSAGLPNAAAAVAGAALAGGGRLLVHVVGGFGIGPANPLTPPHQAVRNIGNGVQQLGRLFGVTDRPTGVPTALEAVRVVALAAVVVAVLAAVARLAVGLRRATPSTDDTDTWRLDDLLVFGVVGSLVLYLALSLTATPNYARYLTAAVVFGAVLTGRSVTRLAGVLSPTAVIAAVLAVTFALGAGYAITVTRPGVGDPGRLLARFLRGHHLTEGLGDYWSASLVTVDSGGAVAVRPVTTVTTGTIARYYKQSSADWYRGQRFQFLVYNTAVIWEGVTDTTAEATWGRPARTYLEGTYEILVWPHPVSLSPVAPRS